MPILTRFSTLNQCPKLTPACSPVACKFIVGRVEITNVHAHLASKIWSTINMINKVIMEKMKYQCSLDIEALLAAHNTDSSISCHFPIVLWSHLQTTSGQRSQHNKVCGCPYPLNVQPSNQISVYCLKPAIKISEILILWWFHVWWFRAK